MIGWLLNALRPMFNAYTGQELVQQYKIYTKLSEDNYFWLPLPKDGELS